MVGIPFHFFSCVILAECFSDSYGSKVFRCFPKGKLGKGKLDQGIVFKNCHRPNSGAVIYTDKGCVTTVGGSATSLKQMKLIYLSQKEHGFCFFELGISTFYCCMIKTLKQNCLFPFRCLFIATSPNLNILYFLSALHLLTAPCLTSLTVDCSEGLFNKAVRVWIQK